MEKQNKKIFSTVLMMVGVLCIVVSGGIFVSRTWQYLPEFLKKLCLVLVAGAFFGGSVYLEKQGKLRKAPVALYYLGVCFTGFSVFALISSGFMEFAGRLCVAMLAMSVPVIIRFLRAKDLADLIIQICLSDGMILCIAEYAYSNRSEVMTLCTAIFTAMLAGFVYYCRRDPEEDQGLIRVGKIAFVIHAVFALPYLINSVNACSGFLFSVLPVFLVIGAWTALYLSCPSRLIRISQSLMLLLGCYAISSFLFKHMPAEIMSVSAPAVFFTAYVLGLILMIALGRKELLYVNGAFGFFYTFIQLLLYAHELIFVNYKAVCFPYGIAMAVAIVFWYYFREGEWDRHRFMKYTAIYFLLGLNSQISWFWPKYLRHYGRVFWFALLFLQMAYALEKRSELGKVFAALSKSFSLFLALTAVLANQIIPTEICLNDGMTGFVDFSVEYDCIFAGLGIVLLGKIWYSIFQDINRLQYVGVCILLGVLLMNNMLHPHLANVLFLAVVTLGMLVVSSILKNKKYAIASALTLALVVLYLTREFWMSIAWWVYLFVAGVGLVIFAIKKEKAE